MKLLDLFCCEGGAAAGYQRAGWDVTGVDREPRFAKRYPGRFVAGDALDYLQRHGHEYDAVHMSPPCQGYTIATVGNPTARAKHERLIETCRIEAKAVGVPYIIENVAYARADMLNPITLCGTMFGLSATDDDGTVLELRRHRLFESSEPILAPGPCRHGVISPHVGGVYGGGRARRKQTATVPRGGYTPAKHVREQLLGIDWMTLHGLSQSLPPVYTEWLGRLLLQRVAPTQKRLEDETA